MPGQYTSESSGRTRGWAIHVVACLLGLYLTFHPSIRSGFVRMQPEAGDCALNNYFLEHTYRWAFDRDYKHSFWSPPFFHPTPNTFTYSETLIGTAPIYWALRAIGWDELIACQLWLLLLCVANYASMAIVLRWFGVGTILSTAGAYLFAFGLLRVSQLSHQQMAPQFASPFVVWYLWAFLQAPTPRRWAIMCVLATHQVFASLHLGWFLGLGLGVLTILAIAFERGTLTRLFAFVRQRPVAAVLVPLLCGACLAAFARTYYANVPERREYWGAAWYAPEPDGWFVSMPGSFWANRLTHKSFEEFHESALFQGMGLFIATVVGLVLAFRSRRTASRFPLFAIGTALILVALVTRWPSNFLMWYIVYHGVPGANAFRAISRLSFAVYLFATLGGLSAVQIWLNSRSWSENRKLVLSASLAVLMIAEQIVVLPASFDTRDHIYGPARRLADQMRGADVAYVVFDDSMPDYRHHITAMWAGLWANVPVMNGFTGSQPRNYPAYQDRPTDDDLLRLLGPEWKGRLVIIDQGRARSIVK